MTIEIQIQTALEYHAKTDKIFKEEPCPIMDGILVEGENVYSTDALTNTLVFFAKREPDLLIDILESCDDMRNEIQRYDELCRPQVPSENSVSFVDTMMFRPTRANDWDPYLERLNNPYAMHKYCITYDLEDVNGYAIGLKIMYNGKETSVIADHNHDSNLSVYPFIVPQFAAQFFDKNARVLKDNYTPEKAKAFVRRELTENPRYIKFQYQPTPSCPNLCDNIEAIEERLVNLFMNQFDGSPMPDHIVNTNYAHLPSHKPGRKIVDCLRPTMEDAHTSFGVKDGEFKGQSLVLARKLKGRGYNWERNGVAGFKFASLVSENRKTTWNDTDPQVFDSFANYMEEQGFMEQNVDTFGNVDTASTIDFMTKLVNLASLVKGTKALQASLSSPYFSSISNVNGEYIDKTFSPVDDFDVAGRYLFVKFVEVYGESSLQSVFGRNGKFDRTALEKFELKAGNRNYRVKEVFSLYYTDSKGVRKYVMKDVETQESLNALLNPDSDILQQIRICEEKRKTAISNRDYKEAEMCDVEIERLQNTLKKAA